MGDLQVFLELPARRKFPPCVASISPVSQLRGLFIAFPGQIRFWSGERTSVILSFFERIRFPYNFVTQESPLFGRRVLCIACFPQVWHVNRLCAPFAACATFVGGIFGTNLPTARRISRLLSRKENASVLEKTPRARNSADRRTFQAFVSPVPNLRGVRIAFPDEIRRRTGERCGVILSFSN